MIAVSDAWTFPPCGGLGMCSGNSQKELSRHQDVSGEGSVVRNISARWTWASTFDMFDSLLCKG
jgi:hypothetical protein